MADSVYPANMPQTEVMSFGDHIALCWPLHAVTKTVTAVEDRQVYTVTVQARAQPRPTVRFLRIETLPSGEVRAVELTLGQEGLSLQQARQLALELRDAGDYLQALP